MYSNDDDQRRRDDEAAYQRRREADDAAYQRRSEEERRVNEMLLRQKREQQDSVNDQFRRERNEEAQRHGEDWADWRKRQEESAKRGNLPSTSAVCGSNPPAVHSPSTTYQHPWVEGSGGLFRLGIVLAIIFAPPIAIYAALGTLIQKFPLYAADPSFSGVVANAFIKGLGPWTKELQESHFYLARAWRFKNYWTLFFYGVAVWLFIWATIWLLLRIFRVHRALGVVCTLALLIPMGFFIYVVVHFSK